MTEEKVRGSLNTRQLIRTSPHPKCDVCGSSGFVLYDKLTDNLFGVKGEFSYKKCNNHKCGLIWQDPMILPEDVAMAYEHYYTHSKGYRDKENVLIRRLARMPAHILDSILMRVCGIKKLRKQMRYMGIGEVRPGRLLDIGCGRGEKLILFKELGWDVLGQEVDRKAVEEIQKAGNLKVLCGDLLSLKLEAEQFDAIISNHVIEHVFYLDEMIKECFRLLKPGGSIAIATPNGESFGHLKFKANWRGMEPPRHLRIFSGSSMKSLLDVAGFEQSKIFSNPASSRGVFEASYQLRDTGYSSTEKYPKSAIYYKSIFYQYREWLLCRNSQPVGEEFFATAIKPLKDT